MLCHWWRTSTSSQKGKGELSRWGGATILTLLVLASSAPVWGCLIVIPTREEILTLAARATELRERLDAEPEDWRTLDQLLQVEDRLLDDLAMAQQFNTFDPRDLELDEVNEERREDHRQRSLPLAEAWRDAEPDSLPAHRAVAELQTTPLASLQVLQAFVDSHPQRADGVRELAEAYHGQGHVLTAINLVEDFLAAHPEDVDAYLVAIAIAEREDQAWSEELKSALEARFGDHPLKRLQRLQELPNSAPQEEILTLARGVFEMSGPWAEEAQEAACRALSLKAREADLTLECLEREVVEEVVPGQAVWARVALAEAWLRRGQMERSLEVLSAGVPFPELPARLQVEHLEFLAHRGGCEAVRLLAEEHGTVGFLDTGEMEGAQAMLGWLRTAWQCGFRDGAVRDLQALLMDTGILKGEESLNLHQLPDDLVEESKARSLLQRRSEQHPRSVSLYETLDPLLYQLPRERVTMLRRWVAHRPEARPAVMLAEALSQGEAPPAEVEAAWVEAVRRQPEDFSAVDRFRQVLHEVELEGRMASWGRRFLDERLAGPGHFLLAIVAQGEGRLATVAEQLQKAREHFADDRRWGLDQALLLALRDLGHSVEVEALLVKEAARRNPDFADRNVGSRLVQLQLPERALPYLRRVVAQEPHSAPDYWALGHALEATGAWKEAEQTYHQAYALDPYPSTQLLEALAAFYNRQNRFQETVEMYQRHPPGTWDGGASLYAEALLGVGAPQKALDWLLTVIEEGNNDASVRRWLAEAHRALGQTAEARAVLQGLLNGSELPVGMEREEVEHLLATLDPS